VVGAAVEGAWSGAVPARLPEPRRLSRPPRPMLQRPPQRGRLRTPWRRKAARPLPNAEVEAAVSPC